MGVHVTLFGGFRVAVDDVPVPAEAWARRDAAALVKLLALSRDRRLHREQVMEALWPGIAPAVASPRLHKAAHYARRAFDDDPAAVVLRQDLVGLLPGAVVSVDVHEFHRRGAEALRSGDRQEAEAALQLYAGALLPEDVYEPWTESAREAARVLQLDLLRVAHRWEELLEQEPADEQAHLALARSAADRGDTHGALRRLERMEQALRHELGAAPPPEAEELRARLESRSAAAREGAEATRLFGRREVGDRIREALARAEGGRGSTLVVKGSPGVGKSAVLDLAVALAHRRGWRSGRGTSTSVEGPWPYAPVLEALGDLCRRHPALLDGLDDTYRDEIERALSGRDMSWTGDSRHQRLFVAAAELVRLAAAGHGLLLVVDDLHEADDASLRLLHYLSRCATTEPVVLALAHREPAPAAVRAITDSMVSRGSGTRVELAALSTAVARRLLADRFPELSAERVEDICAASGGVPFTLLELARQRPTEGGGLPTLPVEVLRTFQRVAVLGTTFSTDELLALSGLEDRETYAHLDVALGSLLVQHCPGGYCFRHTLVRESLLQQMTPQFAAQALHDAADKLAALGAAPSRVAHQYLAAGMPSRAVPYVLRAVDTAGALGAYRNALSLIEQVVEHARAHDLPRLLARRGDLLMALGDPEAVAAYREAVSVTTGEAHRLVRARLSRAASLAGDLDTARAALAHLSLEGDDADAPILLARGNLAYFSGDLDTARRVADQARDRLSGADDPWHLVDLVGLQGLIAHQRGEWFERFQLELQRTHGKQRLSTAVFDAHLCVAEYMLYGPVPYPEVITQTEDLRRRAQQSGALRGVAFATALIGEAAFLMGDLERAERELLEAVELHHDSDASAGEAHSLQRLAEVRLAQGDPVEARRLLQRALPLARWSIMSMHLLQRIYGTMMAAAPGPAAARAVVDRAEATMGDNDHCTFCEVMLAVPAAIACADVADLAEARHYLALAEASVAQWETGAWEAALLEVRAHLARAERREPEAVALWQQAASMFATFGQPLDAARCERAWQAASSASVPVS